MNVLTITLSNGVVSTFDIYNGRKGDTGAKGDKGDKGDQGIQGVQGETGKDFSITKTYPSISAMEADKDNVEIGDFVMISSDVTDPDNAKLYVRNTSTSGFGFVSDLSGSQGIKGDKGDQGIQGVQGEQGVGITSIEKTSTQGLVDTYTITLSNGNTSTFTVTNADVGSAYTKSETDQLLDAKVDKVSGKGLSTNDFTSTLKTKLNGVETGAQVNKIETVKVNGTAQTITSKAVDITVPTKTSDLTNDSNFAVDSSYVHTDNNFTTTLKNKLDGIASGAEVNVQSDWNVSDSSNDAFIKNKPTIPTKTSQLTNDSGFLDMEDLNDEGTITAEGTIANLTNTYEDAYIDTTLKGNTTQNGTPTPTSPQQVNVVKGKNLFGFFLTNKRGDYNTTSTIIDVNTLQVTSTSNTYANTIFYLDLPNGTYTFKLGKVVNSNPSMTIKRMTLSTFTGNTRAVVKVIDEGTPQTITITNDTNKRYALEFWATYSSALVNTATFSEVQIEQGTTATPYIPYQTIQAKVVGKNLFINNFQNLTKNGITFTKNEDGSITLNGTNTSGKFFDFYFYGDVSRYDSFEIEDGTYTLSGNSSTSCSLYAVLINKSNSTTIIENATSTSTSAVSNIVGARLFIRIFANKSFNNYTIYPQLEKSNTATTYEAYKEHSYPITLGDIELCKIGTYQDRIYKNNGKWYLEKQTGKVVFNGSESWGDYATATIDNTYLFGTSLSLPNNSSNYITTHFTTNTAAFSTATIGSYVFNNQLRCRVPSTIATTISNFKTWLGTHNVIVYYILQTPTTTEITDETLLEQLEELEKAKSYEGTTNVVGEGNLPPIISATSYQNIITGKVNSHQEHIQSLTKNLDSLSTNIGTLSNLTTTNKTNVVSAINEVDENSSLNTQHISQLTTNKLDKTGGTITGDLAVNGDVSIGETNTTTLQYNGASNITQILPELSGIFAVKQSATPTTDSYSWYKIDFGAFTLYYKNGTWTNLTHNANSWGFFAAGLPTGLTFNKDKMVFIGNMTCEDAAITYNLAVSSGSNTISVSYQNKYTQALTKGATFNWAVIVFP